MKQPDMIFGLRAIIEAIEAGKEIDKVLVKNDLKGELSSELFQSIREHEIHVQRVPVERINRVTRKNHQGAIAWISQITYHNIENLMPAIYETGKVPFVLVLDGITDVRNFGAIARTAECAGVDAIVIPTRGSVNVTADAIKTSAGALHKIPVCKVNNLAETLRFLQQSGLTLFGATEKGNELYSSTDFLNPLAIVMGAEDKGLSSDSLKICDHLINIPIKGTVGSLNVSVAAGIVIYDVIRQRNLDGVKLI